MSDKLMRTNSTLAKSLNTSLQAGSLKDLIRTREASNVFLLCDCSGSMRDRMRNGKTRIDGLRETVRGIQSERELKMVQFGYGNEPGFVTAIPDATGGTPLHLAIAFAKNNQCSRAIVISDGQPDDQNAALDAAKAFGGRIDVVFVGDEGDPGEVFLKRLAQSTGGESFTGDLAEPKQLTKGILGLLTDGTDDDEDDDDA